MSPIDKKPKTIFYIIYSSQERNSFTEEDVKKLLNQSRDFNSLHQITGILLYVQGQKLSKNPGKFMQLIEGEEELICQLYKRIEKDPRHKDVQLIQMGRYNERSFPDWTMGFEQFDDQVFETLTAHFNLTDAIIDCKPFPSEAPLEFLQSFAN